MEVVVGKYAGFCQGVSRALAVVHKEMAAGRQICTYGAVCNNKHVTRNLEQKGVRIIDDISEANASETVLIRSHGAPPGVYAALEARGIPYIDCTCGDVRKIHRLVEAYVRQGYTIIIAGDEHHPEVVGIKGYAKNSALMAPTPEAAAALPLAASEKAALVVQTTFLQEKFDKIVKVLYNQNPNIVIHNTICQATVNRQKEAETLSKTVDAMLVIGDPSSSNTNKLYEICQKNCKKTFFIETFADLQLKLLQSSGKIGIVAGASTPPDIIKEASLAMSEMGNAGLAQGNQTFEEMLNESFVTLKSGDIITGSVIQASNGEVSVNLGYKSDGLIPKGEFSDDPDVDPANLLQPGDEIEVFVVRVNDGDGNVLLSKKKIDTKRSYDTVEAAFNEKTPVTGRVAEVVKGGLIVSVGGVRVFVPSSQVSTRYVEDLSQFLGQTFDIEIIEFDKSKRRIVGSRKALAAKEQEEKKEQVFARIAVGEDIDGTVSRISNFGAFVDLGGVDGLIHISELSWGRVKRVSDVLKEGDAVTVRVLEANKEKGRISLSLKGIAPNPWDNIDEKYAAGQIVQGKVVRMAPFGAFVELEEGVDGLIHISHIANRHIQKPDEELSVGQIINVKVLEVNKANTRISLSKKEADGVTEQSDDEAAHAPAIEEPAGRTIADAVGMTLAEVDTSATADASADASAPISVEESVDE